MEESTDDFVVRLMDTCIDLQIMFIRNRRSLTVTVQGSPINAIANLSFFRQYVYIYCQSRTKR